MPVGDHGLAPGQAELLLGRHLGGEAVAVPAEAALDAPSPHGLEAGDGVFHESREEVAVVGEPVRKGGPVVKDVLGLGTVQGDRGLEGLGPRAKKRESPLRARGNAAWAGTSG